MISTRNATICASLAFALAGCGGSSNTVLPSLYVGSWSGTWSGPLANDGGTMTFTISADGSITAGAMGRTESASGTLGGIVNNRGLMTATANFPTNGNFLITGQMVLNQNTLSGSFNYSWLGQNYTGTFSETKQSSG